MLDTSIQSFQALGLRTQKSHMDLIESVVRNACRAGQVDISMREIQQVLRRDVGLELDVSSISGRVNNLVLGKRLLRSENARKCTVSGRDIKPLSVPMVQGRLVA